VESGSLTFALLLWKKKGTHRLGTRNLWEKKEHCSCEDKRKGEKKKHEEICSISREECNSLGKKRETAPRPILKEKEEKTWLCTTAACNGEGKSGERGGGGPGFFLF